MVIDFFKGFKKESVTTTPEDLHITSSGTKVDRFLLSLGEVLESKGEKVTKPGERTRRIDKEKLFLCYRLDETTFRCANFYALQVVGPGFELICNDAKSKAVVQDFIERTHLLEKLEDVVRDKCVGGNGWLELIFNKVTTELVDLAFIDFRNMDFIRDANGYVKEDESGNIVGYKFKSWVGIELELSLKQVAHFPLFGRGHELAYGFVEPLFYVIYDKLNVRQGISQAGWRAGFPLWIGTVGDKPDVKSGYPGHKATEAQIDKLANELEDIKSKHKIVKPPWVKIEKIEADKIEFTSLLEYFDTRICGAFGIPVDLALGLGKANKATMEVATTRDLDRRIKSIQNKLSIVIRNEIFSKLVKQHNLKENPKIKWNEITPADLNRAAKRRAYYIETGLINPKDLKPIVYAEEGLTIEVKAKETERIREELEGLIQEGKITIEQAILLLKKIKESFPEETIIKLCDELVAKVMLKTTGTEIPTESGGLDKVKKIDETFKEEE